jgi:CBS domain containing-hemolysin-like protein
LASSPGASPAAQLLILIGNALTPGKGFRDGPFASEAELRELVDLAEERPADRGRRAADDPLRLRARRHHRREVMVPRTDMVFIERGKTLRQAISLALRSGFSRIPVIGENVDDVVGIVYLKDITRRTTSTGGRADRAGRGRDAPGVFVPDSKPVDELLREMQAQRTHIAVVVDEYGGTAGIVTIEDILEEIVGEITDEYDTEAPRSRDLARRCEDSG